MILKSFFCESLDVLFQTQSSPKEILQDFLRGEVEEKSHIKKIKEKQKKSG